MSLPPGLTFGIEDAPSEEDLDALPRGLEAYNEQQWPGHQPWQTVNVLARRDGRVAGGLRAEIYAGWLFLRYFWIEEGLRGGGLGRRIIAAAERRAQASGCHSAWVDTFSFQAPGFYEKQGYVEFARLPYPPKGERLFLRKRLTEDAP
ncbi:MAG: GNAT family N-acetyltransferase [Paracraurococcus sp.]|jgi:GNAT superfamily N-acetyltransferase